MIRAALMTDKGPIGIVGLNKDNLTRLQAGLPLDIDIKAITPPGTRMNRIIVHYAYSYSDVVRDMEKEGLPVTDQLFREARDMDIRLEAEKKPKKKKL